MIFIIFYVDGIILPLSEYYRRSLSYVCTGTENMTVLYGKCFPHTRRMLRYPIYDYDIHLSDDASSIVEATPVESSRRTVRLPRFFCTPHPSPTYINMITLKCNSTDNTSVDLNCVNSYELIYCDVTFN